MCVLASQKKSLGYSGFAVESVVPCVWLSASLPLQLAVKVGKTWAVSHSETGLETHKDVQLQRRILSCWEHRRPYSCRRCCRPPMVQISFSRHCAPRWPI